MTKQCPSGDLVPSSSANPLPQRYLYLIFDDWSSGYSIRKVDLHQLVADNVTAEGATDAVTGHIIRRTPPVDFRVNVPRGLPMYFAAAFNTKILVMHPREVNGVVYPMVSNNYFPVLDVHAPSLMFGPQPKAHRVNPIYIPVGNMLFALAVGSFEVLCAPPSDERPAYWEWSWSKLMKPPFKRKDVTSYTVHPDGQTIFISIQKGTSASTFTFDTLMDGSEWKLHGQWMLPFTGRAYFVPELDAWVGLSRDQETIGHLCCHYVVSADSDGTDGQDRPLKLCKEKLFSENPCEKHVGANLLYLGGGSNFCLIQCISIEDDSSGEMNVCKMEDGTRRYVLRVLAFSLKYDKNGDLTTCNTCRVWYCKVPKSVTESVLKHPLAFWL